MRRITRCFVLLLVFEVSGLLAQYAGQNGVLQKSIYDFLKANPSTTTFVSLLEKASQQANDRSVLNALSNVTSTGSSTSQNSFTVFCPVNEALTQVPADPEQLRNDLLNLIVKDTLTLDKLRGMNGQNISKTFGFMPRLSFKIVKNFYSRQLTNSARSKRQITSTNNSLSDKSVYDQYTDLYGNPPTAAFDGPNISPKLPQDELYLMNNAIIMDKFELLNGIVYVISAYPRYFEKSIYLLMKDNVINGLSQNLNFWMSRADQTFKAGDENLKNALNSFGPATYFLPTDQSLNNFNDRDKLSNNSFLFDVLLKSHRISNTILFDYYLDDPSANFLTDTGLPVSTKHTRVNGQDSIEVSIGHVKGKILPDFRNIYCTSGVIHLIDTVLLVPIRNAYQQLTTYTQLSVFRSIVDRSAKYTQLLKTVPTQVFYPTQLSTKRSVKRSESNWRRQTNGGVERFGVQYDNTFKYITVLAPSDDSLLSTKDEILKSDVSIDQFLSAHIIQDPSNKVYYTDHDASLFVNGQTYYTLNPNYTLLASVQKDPTGAINYVAFQNVSNTQIKSNIISGNDRVSNGVIHILDRPVSIVPSSDITSLLDKYASANSAGSPAFSQFVDALKGTGIFNDLKDPAKKYTLFIPTNDALAKYQDIINSGDLEKKKQLIYRHICLDQNLRSSLLQSNTSLSSNANPNLICRNALGQDLTLTKDAYGLISTWQGMASSKIINDFPGVYSSAYLIEQPLFNKNLPNMGLNKINSANTHLSTHISLILALSIIFVSIL